MVTVDGSVVMFTEDRVRALAGISYSQIRYWARGLALPTVDRRITTHHGVRLYDFDATLTILVLAELKRRGHSLQHLRQVASYVRSEGLRFSELRFATSGSRVHFQRPDGGWQDADSTQQLEPEVVPLQPLRAKVRAAQGRDPETVGRREKRRGSMGSKELVAGTRVPVATVRRYLARGIPVAEVLEAFPVLSEQDVEAVRASA